MKKFPGHTNDKKSRSAIVNKIHPTKKSKTLHAVAKLKAGEWMSIFNYQYQESDLEQFVF